MFTKKYQRDVEKAMQEKMRTQCNVMELAEMATPKDNPTPTYRIELDSDFNQFALDNLNGYDIGVKLHALVDFLGQTKIREFSITVSKNEVETETKKEKDKN